MLLKGWSVAQLSIQCDLSYKAMYNIINEETEDMRLSTFVRICDNVGISLVKVLEISNSEILTMVFLRLSSLVAAIVTY